MFEVLDHTADVGLRIRASTLPELMAEAARALFSIIVVEGAEVRAVERMELAISGRALDDLLHDWLAQLHFLFVTQRIIPAEYEIRIDDEGLSATLYGERLDHARHEVATEVKAITYHELKVEQTADGWLAEVVLDL